jgi:2-dehydropantoate 2-reductase
VEEVVSAFNRAGFKTRSEENVHDLIWGKLIINVGINALTAITGLKNGRLPQLEGTRLIMEEAVKEAVSVARAKEIQIPYPDPLGRVIEVCQATAGNIASMLQDVLKEKLTEVDAINGAIVREGDKLGIPTPVNLTLTSLVQAIQETYPERLGK